MNPGASASARERVRRDLFEAALALDVPERLRFLEHKAAGDNDLVNSVLRLLDAEATTEGILDFTPFSREKTEPRPEPQAFGPYRVIRRIGEGGMGTVYACRKDGDDVIVAAKMISLGLSARTFRDAFEKEREILTGLRHSNICHLLDTGVTDGFPFLIMEYVEGQPIDAYCRISRLGARERLALIAQVLDAVAYLHGRKVIHRDLKPSNILVTGDGVVKILDFGIAKVASHMPGMTGHAPTTSVNTIMTLRYSSPEQTNHTLSGRSSDLYAAGVIAYELLTGHHPYAAHLSKGTLHFLRARAAHPPKPPSTANDPEQESGLPTRVPQMSILFRGNVDRLLLNALALLPEKRYRTADQFLSDVRNCIEDRNVLAIRPVSI